MIAEHIQATLAPVCDSVFQLDASQDDTMPFVVYNLTTEPIHTKDGICGYTSQLTVMCVSDAITASVALGNTVVTAMGTIETPEISGARFTGRETSSETIEGGPVIYIEELKFSIKHPNP